MSSEHITYIGRSKFFLTYWCLALAMRDVFANFVTLYSLIYTPDLFITRCVIVLNSLALLIS